MSAERPLISELDLIATVRQIAAERPDMIYRAGRDGTCTYGPNVNNECGCLLGEALLRVGVPQDRIDRLDQALEQGRGAGWGEDGMRYILANWLIEEALASPWLKTVQDGQDNRRSWANAVTIADEKASQYGWVR